MNQKLFNAPSMREGMAGRGECPRAMETAAAEYAYCGGRMVSRSKTCCWSGASVA